MFINFGDNSRLDKLGFSPFAKVIEGIENVDKIYQVGLNLPQAQIQALGNTFLKNYASLDYIKSATYLGTE
jgi:cyclophilin family peptidyl-prolyl cis-trans isomerase